MDYFDIKRLYILPGPSWALFYGGLRRVPLDPRGSGFLSGRALLPSELHISLGFHFFNWLSESAWKGRGCHNLKPVGGKKKNIVVSDVVKRRRLKADLRGGSAPSRSAPGAGFISRKSRGSGVFRRGVSKVQTSRPSQVRALPCALLSSQFSVLFLTGF